MNVIWTPEAEKDREAIWAYIVSENPRAAIRMDQLFSETVALIAEFPMVGHPGRVRGTREFVIHENYRLIYEITRRTIWVLALVHCARLWPSLHRQA